MLGMFILKEVQHQAYCMGLVLILTAVYYWNVANVYVPLANQLPFDMATSMDLDDDEANASSTSNSSSTATSMTDDLLSEAEIYMQPPLRVQAAAVDFVNQTKPGVIEI
jgi:hypothetical protein